MGLLELYNQITNGILPTGDDKKHIDNMPLGNPQWENKNDTITDYGNTNQITGKITPGQYPAGPIENFTQKYDQNNTYLDQVYTSPSNNQPSPNQDSLDASRLDNQNNPNPDPTQYPPNVQGNQLGVGANTFTQDDWEGSEYDTKVDRSDVANSPLNASLNESELDNQNNPNPDPTIYPNNVQGNQLGVGANTFTQDDWEGSEYDTKVNRNSITDSPLGNNSLNESKLDNQNNPNPDPTEYPVEANSLVAQNSGNKYYSQDNWRNSKYDTTISNSPLLDSLSTSSLDDNIIYNPPQTYTPDELIGTPNFTPKYTSENGEEYDDKVNRIDTSNSPLYDSLDSSSLDDETLPVYNDPGATTPIDVDGEFNFEPKYTSDEKYDTTISNSPLLDSLDDSTLDDSVVYNTPQTYTPDELIGTPNFTPEYNSDKEYDDNVDRDSKENSPLLEASKYDSNLDRTPNSTPVIYNGPGDTTPDEIEGTFNFSTKYTDREGDDYNDNVNRDNTDNSPLHNSLDNSNLDDKTLPVYIGPGATTPDDIEGTFNFTPEYNPDNEYNDDVKLNNDQPDLSPLYNEFESSNGTPTTFDDPTNYRGLSKKRSPVNGINPLEGSGSGKFNQEYNASKTYLDTISNNITIR